ncbi:unnamed protein product [Rhizoctonia solani]|uniref:Uncharacterized protein n=1 Tax=Rhizoctonia solani TaxID=456999 RepID=A0A8H2ZWF1_9AGAM|nr:unnamed protein product [Rhizoctonia solani]
MPGRRSKSQLGQNEHPSDELPLATPPLTSEAPTYSPAYVDQPELQLSVDIPLPFDTTSCSALSTLFPWSTLAEPLTGNPPITLCYAATSQSTLSTATSNQAGYYNAMRATLPNLNPPVPSAFSLDTEEDDNEESDDEGIKRIICTIPRLFGTVDDTSIEFVLENYARWIPLTLFDPLKVVRKTKLIVLHQFALSATSRSRVLLVARLMNILVNKRALDEQGVVILGLLKDTILKDVIGCSLRYPISDETRQQAASALCNVLELMVIQFLGAPLNSAIKFFEVAVPVFLAACPPPHPPHLLDIFLNPSLSLRHFAATDVILGVITGRATRCRYHIPWSLELSDHLLERQENQGAEWLIGIPDQFILVLAYITSLRRDAQLHVSRYNNYGRVRHAESSSWYNQSTGSSGSGLGDWKGALDSTMMKKLEDDISRIRILPGESDDPALRITRIIVQECWREVVHICFYMALCGASAEDPRVQQAQKKYMRLLDGGPRNYEAQTSTYPNVTYTGIS